MAVKRLDTRAGVLMPRDPIAAARYAIDQIEYERDADHESYKHQISKRDARIKRLEAVAAAARAFTNGMGLGTARLLGELEDALAALDNPEQDKQ